ELHLGVSTLPSSDTPKLTLGYLHKQSIIPIEYCHLAVETVNDTVKKVSANMESLAGIDLSELLAKNPLRLMIRDNGKNGTLAILFFDEKVPQKYLPIFKEWLSRSVSNFELRQVESYAFRYLNSTTIDKQGDGTVQYPIGEHPPITLPSTVFTQTNHSVAELLQREVIRLLPSGKPIIDLYGGFGVFSILHDWKSKTSSDVIESSTESVQSGREYVTQNHLKTNFVKRHLGNRMIPEKVLHRNKSVVLDPPRAGGGKKIMSQLNASGCKNIVYVSCHPAALARDIQLLTNYKIQSIQPFDMFPHTPELETVMHLTTKK
ncbi:hypothetical protein K8I28_00855, partial [bacterium]|nr:hypothetical protein [bacterium]